MSLLVLADRGCKRSAVICRCSVCNRSWQTVDSRDLETRSYAFIRYKTAMNLWLFKIVFPTSTIACSVPLYFVKPCWYLWNTTYFRTSRLMVADCSTSGFLEVCKKDRVAQGWVGPSRCLMDQVLREALGSGLALEQSSWLTRYGQHGTGGVGIVCLCGKGLRRLLKWHMSRLCLCEGGIAEQTN